mgnify:CR=1 FL=1
MHASVPSATLLGVDGRPVRVEVHASSGLPGFTIVGLPDTTCREARDRVRAALLSSSLRWPSQRITVNLAPPALRKAGAGLDLAIAVGLLVASEQLPLRCLDDRAFLGELGLDGSIRPVPGALPLIDALVEPEVIVPEGCAVEAQLIGKAMPNPPRYGRTGDPTGGKTIVADDASAVVDHISARGPPFARKSAFY